MNAEEDLRREEAARWWEYERDLLSFTKEFGYATAGRLLTINGGAIIAYLSFLAASDLKGLLRLPEVAGYVVCSLSFFGGGLILAVAVFALGYFNFGAIANNLPGPSRLSNYVKTGDVSGWTPKDRMVLGTMIAAVVCGGLSSLAFVAGSFYSLKVLMVGAQ